MVGAAAIVSTAEAFLSTRLLMTTRRAVPMVGGMDRALAIQELPRAYADILRWRDSGESDEEIAARLGVHATTLPLLVRIAEAKLVRLIRTDTRGP
jgi:hypothetical protein